MGVNGSKAFRRAIASFDGLVIIDFHATWCMPCKVMTPILEQMVQEYPDQVKIFKLDVDGNANQRLIKKYQISAVPTFIVFRKGKQVDRITAIMSKQAFVERLGLDEAE